MTPATPTPTPTPPAIETGGCALECATERYRALIEEIGVPLILAGEARRLRPAVSGLVVLSRHVDAAEAGDDLVLLELRRMVDAGGMVELEGLSPGFRRARLAMRRVSSRGRELPAVPLTVARYDAGAFGNYGLTLLRETGPEDFVVAFYEAARDLGLRCTDGALFHGTNPLATPTEESAFEAVRLPWVTPGGRSGSTVRRIRAEAAA